MKHGEKDKVPEKGSRCGLPYLSLTAWEKESKITSQATWKSQPPLQPFFAPSSSVASINLRFLPHCCKKAELQGQSTRSPGVQ